MKTFVVYGGQTTSGINLTDWSPTLTAAVSKQKSTQTSRPLL